MQEFAQLLCGNFVMERDTIENDRYLELEHTLQ